MHLEHFQTNFEKRSEESDLQFVMGAGASDSSIDEAAGRLGVSLPEQIRLFYASFNGVTVSSPSFEILPLNQLDSDEGCLIHFATADKTNRICLDRSSTNEAGQWDILGPDDGYIITHTFSSFWSNKNWKWIDRGIPFWRSDWLTYT